MRKMMTMLLLTALIIGLTGCGTNNGSTTVTTSEDAFSSNSISAETEVSIEEPTEPATDAIVEEFEYDEPEMEASAFEDYTEESEDTVFSAGSIYNLSDQRSWTETDAIDYLNSVGTNWEKYLTNEQFDLDKFANDLGYEFVEIPEYHGQCFYWLSRGELSVCICIDVYDAISAYVENNSETVRIKSGHEADEPEEITIKCNYFDSDASYTFYRTPASRKRVEMLASLLSYFAKEDSINCLSLPYPISHDVVLYHAKLAISKDIPSFANKEYQDTMAPNSESIHKEAP